LKFINQNNDIVFQNGDKEVHDQTADEKEFVSNMYKLSDTIVLLELCFIQESELHFRLIISTLKLINVSF
jgi:hypothetical protein